MLTIRASLGGRKNAGAYSIVVTDSRNKRDGRFIEKIGYYDPFASRNITTINKVALNQIKQKRLNLDNLKSQLSTDNLSRKEKLKIVGKALIKLDRFKYWYEVGAQPTDFALKILAAYLG